MSDRSIPWTPEDLRTVADLMEKVTDAVGGDEFEEDDWRWGLEVVIRDDFGDTLGKMAPHGDGWLGFYPRKVRK